MKKMKRKAKIAIGGFIFGCLIAGLVAFYMYGISATGNEDSQVVVTIPKGSSGQQIIRILNEEGLVNNELCAKIHLKLSDYDFKSNSYILNKSMNLKELLTAIEGNDMKYISNTKITVLDGHTIADYAKAVSTGLDMKEEDVLAYWNDEKNLDKWIKDYWFLTDDIKQSGIYYPLEGYLAPETYVLVESDDLASLTKMMLDQTEKNLEEYKDQIKNFKIEKDKASVHEFMTLCSIVQRESPTNSKDRKLITGVLINRLNRPMRLQSDVTVNYGNREVKVDVKYKDLQSNNKYNTYRNDGLPVGPISSFNKPIIEDVLNYKESDYYFFFATKDAKVLYAKTFDEHKENVRNNKWY